MNVAEFNTGSRETLPHYFAIAFPLSVIAVCVLFVQRKHTFNKNTTFFERLGWPVDIIETIRKRTQKSDNGTIEVISEREQFERVHARALGLALP